MKKGKTLVAMALAGAMLLPGGMVSAQAAETTLYAADAVSEGLVNPNEATDHAMFNDYYGYISMKPEGETGKLSFNVTVETAGEYDITVVYTAKEGSAKRKFGIYANDAASLTEVDLPCAADWDTFLYYTTALNLTAGSNEIVLTSPSDYDDETVKTPNIYAITYTVEETVLTQYMDCFEPMPIISELSTECWGAPEIGARDQGNGLEDSDMSDYSYWDGGIIKDSETGVYYLFASRWNQAGGHWGQDGISGWQGSQAVYATSDNLYGPYTDQGALWPDWCEGAGHNVFPFTISESDPLYAEGYRYAISISDTGMHGETANGTIHISKSLAGPWELIDNGNDGKLNAVGGSGFSLSNISILVRPDGRYEATNRNGDLALADSLTGTWEVVENGLWWQVDGMSSDNVEDPVIWYSDGLYHIIANKWDARMAYYLTSEDGLTNWTRHPGAAYTPDADFLRYEDGTVNHWTKIERPSVYIEDGKLVAMTFAVIDVQKEEDFGNDQHGSKVIVVPFSSGKLTAFDAMPDPFAQRDGILPIADTNIQSWGDEVSKNYGAEEWLQLQKDTNYLNHGKGALGEGTRPDEWYDSKIAYIQFDISSFDLTSPEAVDNALLTLIYLNKPSGDAQTEQIQVTLSDNSWTEGNGKESTNRNRASDGTVTWDNQPSLLYNADDLEHTSAVSEAFSTADVETEVIIDVTALVKNFVTEHPGETIISFALNVTETGTRIRMGSLEAGSSFAPRLALTTKEVEATPTPVPEEPTPAPAQDTPVPTEQASADDTSSSESTSSSSRVIIIVLSVIVVVLGAAIIVLVRKKKK